MVGKMFLAQKWMNRGIFSVIGIDLLAGYGIRAFSGHNDPRLMGLLYLLNIVALIMVYRFWKIPLFEWDDVGFVLYGISPFKKTYGSWERIQKAGFNVVTDEGAPKELFIVVFLTTERKETIGVVPMKFVGFADKIKEDFMAFARRKKIPPLG